MAKAASVDGGNEAHFFVIHRRAGAGQHQDQCGRNRDHQRPAEMAKFAQIFHDRSQILYPKSGSR